MITIVNYPGDEGGPQAYAKEYLINRNCILDSLTAVNKGASGCYLQLFDTPRKLDVAITDTNNTTGVLTAAAHEFQTGDKLTFTGIAGLTTHYVEATTSGTLRCYSTRALALAGGPPDVLPTNNSDPGTASLASDAASAPVCEEYPLGAEAASPTNLLSYTNGRFKRGCYLRAVTAVNGSTLISAADVKFTPRYRTHPIIKPVAYED